ncbi:MAG TPA: response regulator [Candidatus Dojkabacteria bacterium]|jgi:CheY-like chemotaxis protein|nr:response regulator [Candidatus Dojkabacteria bacterium]
MEDLKKTILIVEDEKDLLESYKELITMGGYNVVTASDGYEGLDYLSRNVGHVDLVLLDLMMPGVDGLEVLKAVQADKEKYGDMPIIVLTNMSSELVIKDAFDLGASSYFVKSDLDYEGLLRELNKYLGD